MNLCFYGTFGGDWTQNQSDSDDIRFGDWMPGTNIVDGRNPAP